VAERLFPGARLRAVRRLTGGVSADVHALELEGTDGRCRTVVIRQHGAHEWKPGHGQLAATEHGLLQILHRAGLPVAEPLLLDTTGQLFARPYLITTFVDGSVEVPADSVGVSLDVMAATLVRLHTLPVDGLPELPQRMDPLPELYDYLPELAEWRALRAHLSRWTNSAYRDEPVLLHGDFWPGNLLWREGRLVAILDWEDAALGDPMSDVAGCRLELTWKYGPEAAGRFTLWYGRQRTIDRQRLALWEVYVGSAAAHYMGRWGLEPTRERQMRSKAHGFVREAARTLLARQDPD
jgi:aminoglycoside phosphotransferase (APT) family kinase protein